MRDDPPEYRTGLELIGQPLGIFGERARVDRFTGIFEAGLGRHRGDGPRIVSRNDLDPDPLALEVPEDRRSVSADPVPNEHERYGLQVGRERLGLESGSRAREEHDARAFLGVRPYSIGDRRRAARGRSTIEQHLRGAEHPRATAEEGGPAPLPGR